MKHPGRRDSSPMWQGSLWLTALRDEITMIIISIEEF
jgi:hypothetical protein